MRMIAWLGGELCVASGFTGRAFEDTIVGEYLIVVALRNNAMLRWKIGNFFYRGRDYEYFVFPEANVFVNLSL